MSAVLDEHGNALVFDTETGDVHTWAVPTALENVARSDGRYVHGATGERRAAKPAKAKPVAEPVIELKEEELLDLPTGEAGAEAAAPEAQAEVEPAAETAPRPRPRPRAKATRRAKK